MLRILLFAFLFYLLCQFIFRVIIPVYKTTKEIKKGFRKMNDQMNGFAKDQPSSQQTQTSKNNSSKEPVGDYIDFEEIK